jgi:hypothetical protein
MKKYIAVLIGIEIILFATNFIPGTFLVGWDNVMPEFNLSLNFQRSLYSLWQEYRGLGLIDGMAHSANLFHTLYIALLNLFLPDSIVRYLYIHITHLAGGIGFFLLCSNLFHKGHIYHKKTTYTYWEGEQSIEEKRDLTYIPAFIGALFYLFNIGIIQMYYAPLEVFATHFAALPILALTTYNAIHHTTKKNLFFLFLSALLLTPQAFVPTVFIAYSILVIFQLIYSLFYKSEHTHKKLQLKHTLLIGITLFLANAFWLVPYAYSALTTPKIISQSRINEFSSEEIFYRNQSRGTILDTLTFKGFMLDSLEYDQQNSSYFQFMNRWHTHIQNPLVLTISILFALLSLLGIVLSIFRRKSTLYPFVGAAIISGFFLANGTPILTQANDFIRQTVPLVGEAFRFPFTKFITLFAFCMSIFMTYLLAYINEKRNQIRFPFFVITLVGVVILAYPAFRGYFTAPQLRLSIPSYYQETFSYFSTQPHDTRVALMPSETFWNWGYTAWGHRGSGFIWHGIPQALLMRAFDPWSLENEQFYNELSFAQSTENHDLFARVLRKYDVHYLLLDESILNSLSRQPINYDEIYKFMEKIPGLREDKRMGKIIIYKTDTAPSFVYTLNKKQTIKAYPSFLTSREDTINSMIGNYVVTDQNPDIYTPFPSLSTDKLQQDMEMSITETNNTITFTPKNQKEISVKGANLILPSYFQNEFLIPVTAQLQEDRLSLVIQNPIVSINNQQIQPPTTEFPIQTNISNPTTILFSDIEHQITINSSELSYLIKSPATTLIVSNGEDTETIVIDVTQQDIQPIVIPLPENSIQSLHVTVPKIQSPLSEINIIQRDDYTMLENPTSTLQYLVNPLLRYTKNNNSLEITSQNGSMELAYYKENLYHQASYLVFIDAKYTSGLPVNFYIDNTFRERAIVETKLSKEEQKNIIVLPRTEEYFQGYGFHVIGKSVGKEVSQATINRIAVYPAPIETIKRIRIADVASPVFSEVSADSQGINYTKKNNMHYITTVAPGNYLVLSQSVSSGWNAYVTKKDSSLQTIFPFLGDKLTKITVNNWKNGWETPSQYTQPVTIQIIFLPLYFQLAGLSITFGGVLIFVILFLFHLRKNS